MKTSKSIPLIGRPLIFRVMPEGAVAEAPKIFNLGIGTWNQLGLVQMDNAGNTSYAFRLHVQLRLDRPGFGLDAWRTELQSQDKTRIAAEITGFLGSGPFDKFVMAALKMLAAAYGNNTVSPDWAIRAFHDYNSDLNQAGDFVEFEYTQEIADNEADVMEALLKAPSDAGAQAAARGVIQDGPARAALGI